MTGPGATTEHARPHLWWRGLGDQLSSIRPLDAVLPMTLLLVLFPGGSPLHYVAVALAAGSLAIRRVRRLPWTWFTIAGLRAGDHLLEGWFLVDNHHYLLTYWCVAIGFVLLSREPGPVLRTNARLLLGLCFAFATAWKFLGGEYLDGSFPGYLLLTDPHPSSLIPGLSIPPEVLETNRQALAEQAAAGVSGAAVRLEGVTRGVQTVAVMMGLWTIAIELLIATAFLLPLKGGWRRMGDLALLVFIATTYPLAPVLVFGLLLLVMGFSQTRSPDTSWRLAYLLGYVVLPPVVYTVADETARGVAFTGAIFLLTYLYRWERWALVAGFMCLGLTPAFLDAGLTESLIRGLLGVGSAALGAVVLDLIFRRRTESWLRWAGLTVLLVGTVLAAVRPSDSGLGVLGSWGLAAAVALLLAGWLQTRLGSPGR